MTKTLPDLLQHAGANLRGYRPGARNSSIDCPRCGGRRDLSFNSETFHCFRCLWSGNKRTLAKELGLAPATQSRAERLASSRIERAERMARSLRSAFDGWRDRRERATRDEYRELGLKAALAKRVLALWPDAEPAWDALSAFYHAEARLSAELERLACARTPSYADDTSAAALVEEWKSSR